MDRQLVTSGAVVIPNLLRGRSVAREDAVGRPKDSSHLIRPHRAINIGDLSRIDRAVMVEPRQMPGVSRCDPNVRGRTTDVEQFGLTIVHSVRPRRPEERVAFATALLDG